MPLKPNRLFYTVKLNSDRVIKSRRQKNSLNLTFEQCLERNYIISLSDSQMLKTIRDVTGKVVDYNQLEEWYNERDRIKKSKSTVEWKKKRIKELQNFIYNMMYIPEYITVTMTSKSGYEKLFKTGFWFNGVLYKRGGCSASQARVSTVVFIKDDIRPEIKRRLDNGRNLDKKIAPSKYNAYYGLYSSASKKVTTPRFCIIPDFESSIDVKTDWCIETDWTKDDIIEERILNTKFNRFDGGGIISPQMAEQWGRDLNEDYTPCQFCIRWCFTKGCVNEFDFVDWCKEEAGGVYEITDIYGKKRDLREIDVIITEGMAKLWDSWNSQEEIEGGCAENGIDWRVTKYAPKADKVASTMNYQYIQTLDFGNKKEEIEDMCKKLCKDTIDYIKGVNYDDPYYSMLFLMGQGVNEEGLNKFLQSSDDWWLKSCVIDNRLFNDKYSVEKIRKMVQRKIELACLGRVYVKGNYQAIVPDSYGLMEWVVWRNPEKVKGLLEDGEFYSQFWEKRGIKKFGCARSPMTSKAEWVVSKNGCYCGEDGCEADKERAEKIRRWFKYDYSGIITNIHGQYTMNFAGSDFDYDIMFTTDSNCVVGHTFMERGDNGAGGNLNVTGYDVPKPEKKPRLTEEDLFISDTFSFGQQIGQLTNVSTEMYAMLSLFEAGSQERELLEKRIQMTCIAQSKQIDKTKLGKPVKCIADIWIDGEKIEDDDSDEVKKQKMVYNRIKVGRKPYFFKYKYNSLNGEIREFVEEEKKYCLQKYKKHLDEVLKNPIGRDEEDTVEYYYDHYPSIETDCQMNILCKYMEGVDFAIKNRIRATGQYDYRNLMWYETEKDRKEKHIMLNGQLYTQVIDLIKQEFKKWDEQKKLENAKTNNSIVTNTVYAIYNASEENGGVNKTEKIKTDILYRILKHKLEDLIPHEGELSNYLIYAFYNDLGDSKKNTLWGLIGKQIYENIVENKVERKEDGSFEIHFPVKVDNPIFDTVGNPITFTYLYENYAKGKCVIDKPKTLDVYVEDISEIKSVEESVTIDD